MLGISTAGIAPVPRRSALKISRRDLPEGVSFGLGTPWLLGNRAWKIAAGVCDVVGTQYTVRSSVRYVP